MRVVSLLRWPRPLKRFHSVICWNDKYTSSPKAAHYKQIFQNIENDNCRPRLGESTTLFRLQTGHTV